MLLSSQTMVLQRTHGYEGCVRKFKEIGFDAYDFSMFGMVNEGNPLNGKDYLETAKSLRKAADEAGIICNQTHAPFPLYKPNDENWNASIMEYIVRSLEITSVLGGKICIVHPYNHWSPETNAEKVYLPLLPYCQKYGVKIALENMWSWPASSATAVPCACSTKENFLQHLSLLDPEWYVACLDIGHAEKIGEYASAKDLIYALGSRLQSLHVHDNDKKYDLHTYPYNGKIEWEGIFTALREIGYKGDLTFEADFFIEKYPQELREDALRFLYKIGRYMIDRIVG